MINLASLIRNGQMMATLGSGLLIALAWLLSYHDLHHLSVMLYITAYLVGGYVPAKEGVLHFINKRKVSVNLLMVLAAIGSLSIGYWLEGAVLIFIFSLSGALESYAIRKSHKEISSLIRLQPEEATLIVGDQFRKVDVKELTVGQKILIRPGERIPIDGLIVQGSTSVDESVLTGEAIPVAKKPGDMVFSGTMNGSGTLTVRVHKKAGETLFQKIVSLVQGAQQEISPSQRFIQRFQDVYVNTVLITVAFMMFLPHYLLGWPWGETMYRAIILLVVASPCALVASISPAVLSALSNSARRGVLLKSGMHLETLAQISLIGLDKTGTLTQGEPKVTDLYVKDTLDRARFLAVVGSVEQASSHPLADAISRYVSEQGIPLFQPDQVRNVAGQGVVAVINGEEWKVGQREFVGKEQADSFQSVARRLEREGKTVVYVARDHQLVGLFALKDMVRPDSKQAVAQLKRLGIEPVLLTGDTHAAAQAIANEVGITRFYAQCLPEDKVAQLKQLQREDGGEVAMVGDGINDAPALATASVGITMGAGSDVAIETGDVVLVKNNLVQLARTVELARRMKRIIKQNVIFSIGVIILLILANAFQLLTLPLGVIGHEGSTLLVILNGLRLLKGTQLRWWG